MARRHLTSVLSGDEQDLDEVWEWYVLQGDLISEEVVRTLNTLSAGRTPAEPRYFGLSRDEIKELFRVQREELKQAAMLILLAATEAALKVDFIVRVRERKNDAVSRSFAALYKKSKLRVRLEEDLLDAWERHGSAPSVKTAAGRFKDALLLRNWLAHGRFWKPKLSQEYAPQDVFGICNDLLKAASIR